MKTITCSQCLNPNQKGVHTFDEGCKEIKPVTIDLADTETIKNVLIKADREHRQYMIISNLEVWDNIDILVKAVLASMNFLVSQGENKKEVFDKMIKFFEEDIVYKVEKKTNEIPTA